MENTDRPRTVWIDETPEWCRTSEPIKQPLPLSVHQSSVSTTKREQAVSAPVQRKPQAQPLKLEVVEDPWRTWEPLIEIVYTRPVWQARRRDRKAELAHVQQLEQPLSAKSALLSSVGEVLHPSFPVLKSCHIHEGRTFLVWEPVQLSISQILASKCLISESEIAAIVRPVLEGIEYLRRQGRVLAALSADDIQLTQSGSIKIAGIENSCEITAAEMDVATLKLLSLAEIVERLMKKNPPPYRWSAEVESLPNQLRSLPLEELLQVSVIRIASCSQLTQQCAFLRRAQDEGELVMITNVANKTAYHRVDSFSDRS